MLKKVKSESYLECSAKRPIKKLLFNNAILKKNSSRLPYIAVGQSELSAVSESTNQKPGRSQGLEGGEDKRGGQCQKFYQFPVDHWFEKSVARIFYIFDYHRNISPKTVQLVIYCDLLISLDKLVLRQPKFTRIIVESAYHKNFLLGINLQTQTCINLHIIQKLLYLQKPVL